MDIIYQSEEDLSVEEFIGILKKSTLSERRPIDDVDRIKAMIKNADIIITARENGKLVGVSRAVSDFAYCTYLSDLAVDVEYQHKGIGKKLIIETKIFGGNSKLILLSAPKAVGYYPKIGMMAFDNCFVIDHENQIL